MKKLWGIVLVILVLGIIAPGASAHHYYVTSGYDHPAEGTIVYPKPVSFLGTAPLDSSSSV